MLKNKYQPDYVEYRKRFKIYLTINIRLFLFLLFISVLLSMIFLYLGISVLILTYSYEIYLCKKKSINYVTKIIVDIETKEMELVVNKRDEEFCHRFLKKEEYKCIMQNSFKGAKPTSSLLIYKRTGREPILIVKQENHIGWSKDDFETILKLTK